MAKDNKNLNKKPKVNPYWIYGVIIAVFLSVQLFSGGFGGSTGNSDHSGSVFGIPEVKVMLKRLK
jgi:hypothetical protein